MYVTSSRRLRTYLNRRILWGLLGCIYLARRMAGGGGQIYVAPTLPTRWHALWLITRYLGIRLTTRPEEARIGCIHEDQTWVAPRVDRTGWPATVLNARCLDISKRRVADVSREVLGYSCHVDPTFQHGPIVKKSDANGLHDGVIIDGPIARAHPACVYQKVIDNTCDDGTVVDYRVSIMGNLIPFALIKRRSVECRFDGPRSRFEVVDSSSLFSEKELNQILEIAHRMGLEIGEVDVLRDREDFRIHVIDVNKTPAYQIFNWRTMLQLVRLAARGFEEEFLPSPAHRQLTTESGQIHHA